MPIFEYRCPRCGRVQERLEKFNDRKAIPCPCGKHAERQISRSGFSLKGGGWSKDGYGAAKK